MNADTPLMSALGRVPSGLFILSASHAGQQTGMLASWVQQAAFEPPAVTVAVRLGRYVAEWIAEGRPFALSILAEDQKDMLKHFGRGFEPGEPAFEGLSILQTSSNLPVLSDAVGYLECITRGHVDSGDHRIFLAEVTDGKLLREAEPMVYVRKSGAHY